MTPETTSRTIVVGYDGSPAALAAVEYAIDRAIPEGRLVLVNAYDVPIDYAGASYYPEMREDASQYATNVLDVSNVTASASSRSSTSATSPSDRPRWRSPEQQRSTRPMRSSSAAAASAASAPCWAASRTTSSTSPTVPSP